jgi:hypothetical protein
MKMTMEVESDIAHIGEWLRGSHKHLSAPQLRKGVDSLYWMFKELKEQNEVLTRVLVEAAARGIELRAIADAKPLAAPQKD